MNPVTNSNPVYGHTRTVATLKLGTGTQINNCLQTYSLGSENEAISLFPQTVFRNRGTVFIVEPISRTLSIVLSYKIRHFGDYIVSGTTVFKKTAVFWYVTPCGSCNKWSFGAMCRLHHQGEKNQRARNNVNSI
jgi:hypothetical protein